MTRPPRSRRSFVGGVSAGFLGFFSGCIGRVPFNDEEDPDTQVQDTNETYEHEPHTEFPPAEEADNETTQVESAQVEEEPLGPPEHGAVVFSYDDGPIQDYTQAFPVHQEFDAPATTAIVTNWIGRQDFMGTDWLTRRQIRELSDAGWEVISHTHTHATIAAYDLTADAAPEDTRVYVTRNRLGQVQHREVEVADGERAVRVSVAGRGQDESGQFVRFEQPLGEGFAAGEAVIRYPEEFVRHELSEPKRILEHYGFEVSGFVAPYDDYDAWARQFVPEYYDGVLNANHGSRINPPEGFDPLETQRGYFIEFLNDPHEVQDDLSEIAHSGGLGVFAAHTFKDEVTPERIRQVLEWIDERDIEVLTFQDAIRRYTTSE